MKKLNKNLIKLKKQKKTQTEKLVYDAGKYRYDFRAFNTIRTFGRDIYEGKITLEEADEDQSDLTNEIDDFLEETKPKNKNKKQKKNCYEKLA